MALTDTAIKGLKAGSKILKKTDADGLFIEVRTSGDKFFRFRYRNALGKEQTLSLGKYPDLSLAQARKLRDEARQQLALDAFNPNLDVWRNAFVNGYPNTNASRASKVKAFSGELEKLEASGMVVKDGDNYHQLVEASTADTTDSP